MSIKTHNMENNQEILHKELDLIQAVVNRMAANSFEIKKWSLSIVAIVLALGKDELENPTHLSTLVIVIGITIFSFWFLDAYFLRLERMYRKLYEYVIAHPADPKRVRYNLNAGPYINKVASLFKVMFSISLIPFYGIQVLGVVLIWLLLKY
jgi:hypothetical protein